MSEDTAEAETKTNGRGRPRPDATVERDKTILEQLRTGGPQTRKQLVEATGIAGNEVYLSLYRLSRQDPPAIVKNGASWSVTDGGTAPEAETPTEADAVAE